MKKPLLFLGLLLATIVLRAGLFIDPASIITDYNSGDATITVTTDELPYVAASQNPDWLHVVSQTDDSFVVHFDENFSTDTQRTGYVEVTGNAGGFAILTVIQGPKPLPYLTSFTSQSDGVERGRGF